MYAESVKGQIFRVNSMLSIITIVKNAATTIYKCIDSVISQTDKNFEYIIVDGKSTDGTLEIIKSYERNFFKLISEEDSGTSEAFSKGISLAKGKFIFWLSADDWIDCNFTSIVNKIINTEEKDLIIGKMKMFNNSFQNGQIFESQQDIFLGLRNGFGINFPSIIAQRKLFQMENKVSEKYKYCSDLEWLLRINSKNQLNYLVNNEIIVYRMYGGLPERNLISYASEHISILYKYGYPILKLTNFYLIIITKKTVKKVILFLKGLKYIKN